MDLKLERKLGWVKIGKLDLRWSFRTWMLIITLKIFGKMPLQIITTPTRWRIAKVAVIYRRMYWRAYHLIERPLLRFADWALDMARDHAHWMLRSRLVRSRDCSNSYYTAHWDVLGVKGFSMYRGSWGEEYITEVALGPWRFTKFH